LTAHEAALNNGRWNAKASRGNEDMAVGRSSIITDNRQVRGVLQPRGRTDEIQNAVDCQSLSSVNRIAVAVLHTPTRTFIYPIIKIKC